MNSPFWGFFISEDATAGKPVQVTGAQAELVLVANAANLLPAEPLFDYHSQKIYSLFMSIEKPTNDNATVLRPVFLDENASTSLNEAAGKQKVHPDEIIVEALKSFLNK